MIACLVSRRLIDQALKKPCPDSITAKCPPPLSGLLPLCRSDGLLIGGWPIDRPARFVASTSGLGRKPRPTISTTQAAIAIAGPTSRWAIGVSTSEERKYMTPITRR